MKSYFFFLVVFFDFTLAYGQKPVTKLEGRVISNSNDVGAVHISNVTKNRGTITDAKGYFEISVSILDTLIFSAVQFKKKEIVVTQEVLDTRLLIIMMTDALTELNEVVVMPYNLSGELERDMNRIETGPVITASSEGLPNAFLRPLTLSQRKLFAATFWDCDCVGIKLDPLMNYFSGRTKMLNTRVAREAQSKRMEVMRGYYPDSLYIQDLRIPKSRIDDFIYSCENDSLFEVTLIDGDRLKLWELLKKKSIQYLKDNKISGN